MSDRPFATHQQQVYESAYSGRDDEYGIPDRKIVDGVTVKAESILSLGCGAGNDLWYLSSENLVVGVDYAMTGLLVGRRHGIQGVVVDLNFCTTLPFQSNSFDLVVCKDILEHVLEPLPILREVSRVLKPGGRVVISVPNHFFLPLRWRLVRGKGLIWTDISSNHRHEYDEWNYMHIRFFTYTGFESFLRAAGFRPQKWFWDFGSLAHYADPDMWLEPQLWKKAHRLPISRRGKVGLYLIRPLWHLFNAVFPRHIRRRLVSLSPGLLCAGFYVRAVKEA